ACDELRDQLLALRIIPPADVVKAEKQAQDKNTDLETVLVETHLLTEANLHSLRAMRLGAPYCNLGDYLPSLHNAMLIKEDLARRHVMFPLFDLDGVITLVVENPGDVVGIDQVRRSTRKEVDVCVAGKSDILGLIERAYGASKYLEQSSALDEMVDSDG